MSSAWVWPRPGPGQAAGHSEDGASAVEYGLLITGIAALIVVAVFAFGGGVNGLFKQSCSSIFASQSNSSC